MALRFTRAGVAGTLVTLIVAAVCVRLGVWQLHRLDERRSRNAWILERLEAPPIRLSALVVDTSGLTYRRVELEGTFDHARSVVLPGRSHNGAPGVNLLTPLRRADGRPAVLVNRGWIPSPDAATIDIAAFAPHGPAHLEGLIVPFPYRPPAREAPAGTADADERIEPGGAGPAAGTDRAAGRILYDLDVAGVLNRFPYPVEPVYVQALPESAAGADRDAGLRYPVRLGPPSLSEGPHFSYAIQWFSFAAIALVGWTVLVLRQGEVTRKEEGGEDR